MIRTSRFASSAAAVLLLGLLAVPAGAATSGGMSDAFKGFGSNGKEPIQIEADSLEVLDKDRNAVFTGNVHVLQKDTVLKTQRLRVFYAGNGAADLAQAGGSQSIRRFEAEGKVLISQKDQTVTGEKGWFDMTTQTAQITGNVVLTQGKNVARGDRLSIDLKSGQYKLDGAGRVQLILESQQKPAAGN
ncbi:MAG: lipopolysaccharide transport periplasmic protein LptA [Phyllobacteriaceae bacterium]|nr:lipopolysaccharide transport periplasmic protein LptA [Phyllobacteriaceae bacterium]